MQSHKLTLDQAVGSELAQKVRDAKEIKSYDMTKDIRDLIQVINLNGFKDLNMEEEDLILHALKFTKLTLLDNKKKVNEYKRFLEVNKDLFLNTLVNLNDNNS